VLGNRFLSTPHIIEEEVVKSTEETVLA